MSKKAGAVLFFFYAVLFFLLLQYNIYIYMSEMKMYSMTFIIMSFIASVLMVLLGIKKMNFFYALGVPPVVAAIYMFYKAPLDMHYFVFYGISLLFFYAGYSIDKRASTAGVTVTGTVNKTAWIWFFSLLVISAMTFSMFYINHVDKEMLWFMPFRIDKYPGNLSGYDGVITMQFKEYGGLLLAVFYSVGVILCLRAVLKGKIEGAARLLAAAFVLAFVGKIVFAMMTTQGTGTFGAKMGGPLLSGYFYWAAKIDKFYDFIANYITQYQSFHGASHLKGHPPMPVVFYWLIIKSISANPAASAIIYSGITSLAVLPFFYLTRHLTGSEKAGFIAALIYAVTPNSLILSVAGADGMIAFLTVSFLAMAVIGASKGKVFTLLAAGAVFGIGTYFSFGIWHLLMFVFLMLLKWEKIAFNREFAGELLKWTRNVVAVLAGIVLIHLVIWAVFMGKFDYAASFIKAKEVSVGVMLKRPFEIWSWINFLHWTLYASVPLIGMFFYRYFAGGLRGAEADRFSIMAISVIVMQFCAALGRAETQRMYMYLIAFVVPVAVLSLLNKKEGAESVSDRAVYHLTALSLVFMILLQIFVGDML